LGDRPWWKRTKDKLYDRLQRRLTLNSFEFSRDRVPQFLRQLNGYRPDVIVAYTNPLYAFARALEEQRLTPYSPKSIIVGAEKIYPFQRELIERVFRAPVFETYGSREFMMIGGEFDLSVVSMVVGYVVLWALWRYVFSAKARDKRGEPPEY